MALAVRPTPPPSEAEKPKAPDRATILEVTTEEARSRGTLDTAAAAAAAVDERAAARRRVPRGMQTMEAQLLTMLEQGAPGAALTRVPVPAEPPRSPCPRLLSSPFHRLLVFVSFPRAWNMSACGCLAPSVNFNRVVKSLRPRLRICTASPRSQHLAPPQPALCGSPP